MRSPATRIKSSSVDGQVLAATQNAGTLALVFQPDVSRSKTYNIELTQAQAQKLREWLVIVAP